MLDCILPTVTSANVPNFIDLSVSFPIFQHFSSIRHCVSCPISSLTPLLAISPYILAGAGAWSARDMNTAQYIQVDLLERKVITAVAIQGRQGSNEFVKDYYVEYSDGDVPELWKLFRDIYGLPYVRLDLSRASMKRRRFFSPAK